MEKKDLVFLATAVIVANMVPKGLPPEHDDPDRSPDEYFTKWHQYLSEKYDALP